MSLVSTVNGLQTAIARKLNELTVSADRADRYLDWINEGLDDITNQVPNAPWLESSAVLSLVAGSAKYQTSAIDSSFLKSYDARISAQKVKIMYLDKEVFDNVATEVTSQAIPSVFTIFNDEIEFYPTPNASDGVQFNFLRDSVLVSAASAVPQVPRRFLKSLIDYGWFQGLYDREDFQEAQLVEQKYERELAKVKKDLMNKSMGAKRMISIRDMDQSNRGSSDDITRAIFN